MHNTTGFSVIMHSTAVERMVIVNEALLYQGLHLHCFSVSKQQSLALGCSKQWLYSVALHFFFSFAHFQSNKPDLR